MTKPIIAIPGDHPPQLQGSPHLDRLRGHCEVRLFTDRPVTLEEQVGRAQEATCLINSRSAVKWHADALGRLPRLKMITVCGIGTDAIDVEFCRSRGIVVCNLPGRTAAIVAEHALGLMFAVARRAWFQTNEIKSGRWGGPMNFTLRGKTIGLVGTGNIGAEMARLCKAIGMDVIAWTFNPSPEREHQLGVKFVALDELLRTSDVVSVHVKLTDESRRLIGKREIGLMKRGALLVNTARGLLVDTNALIAALNTGHLGGAGLDAFDVEPIPSGHPLLACEQVVLTPHNADQTPEGMDLLNSGVVDNVIAFLEGRPQNVVT